MSRKNRQRNQVVQVPAKGQMPAAARDSAAAKRWNSQDSFANFEARVGVGTDNQSSQGSYGFDFISRNRIQLEAMYRSSWVVGAIVDSIADDMTRAGIDHEGEVDPGDTAKIDRAFERMRLWDAINDTIKWSRLYGSAFGVLLIDGQKMDQPLRLDSIAKGQFKGILSLDRWLVQPTLSTLVQEYGPDFGMPKFYDVVADSMALSRQRIHHSRILRLDGVDLPYWQRISENLSGQSVVERLFDRLVAFDSTTQGAAQLVYKAHLRTYAVDGLRDIIATGGNALDGLLKQIDMIRRFQSNEGLTLMDAKDKFEAHQYAFSGLDNVLLQFGQQLAGACGIPLVRLFGQSPSGMNATGESDLKIYYDNIKQQQERRLSAPLTKLMGVMFRSVLGQDMPDDYNFQFRHLLQMSEKERSEIVQQVTTAIIEVYDAGLISAATALKELKQQSDVTNVFTNITDEMINEADQEPPEPSEGDGSENGAEGSGTEPDAIEEGREAIRGAA
ncbi:DUF1073 domain-containing protein [Solilutibacter silvestris]|uniref:DUF1073 domain-containing protein n=1 Tax=Solilutibacter silvestris TaxID=1645665 RepID=UPI003D3522F1